MYHFLYSLSTISNWNLFLFQQKYLNNTVIRIENNDFIVTTD